MITSCICHTVIVLYYENLFEYSLNRDFYKLKIYIRN
nr:MAG TPA: hypothetical protein [Caudoviricetes sp.]